MRSFFKNMFNKQLELLKLRTTSNKQRYGQSKRVVGLQDYTACQVNHTLWTTALCGSCFDRISIPVEPDRSATTRLVVASISPVTIVALLYAMCEDRPTDRRRILNHVISTNSVAARLANSQHYVLPIEQALKRDD